MLCLYRYNGECVLSADLPLTADNAQALVWSYLGDVNRLTALTSREASINGMPIISVATPCGTFTVCIR